MQNETWEMYNQKRLKDDFNEVSSLTAICRQNRSWTRGDYPGLEIGKTYKVTYIGVFRSRTDIMLEGFGYKDFNSTCFDLYENGQPLGREYVKDFRFLAPYLKERLRIMNPPGYVERQKGVSIISYLHDIEKEYDIKILFAVQTGSRAVGLDGPNSDWDVSYLYVHAPGWYEESDGLRNVIERVCDDDIDTHGWDLKDALSSLKEGDPSLFEWLDSPNAYIVKAPLYRRLNEFKRKYFNPESAISYYHIVYTISNERFLTDKGSLKEFLYFLRGVLACKWVETKGTIPPLNFTYLLEETVDEESIRSRVKSLIKIKRSGKNFTGVEIDTDLIEFVRRLAAYYDDLTTSQNTIYSKFAEELDSFFQEMVSQVQLTDVYGCR